jgi:hypothetical protein
MLNLADHAPPEHLHGFFRFPARLHYRVARQLLERYAVAGSAVADPFLGSGTTLLESTSRGLAGVGWDVDPLSVFISRTKLGASPARAKRFRAFVVAFDAWAATYEQRSYSRFAHRDLSERSYEYPTCIAVESRDVVERWFRRYVIRDLGMIKDAIYKMAADAVVRDIAMLAFASIIRNCSIADPVPVSGLEYTKRMRQIDAEGRTINSFALARRAMRRLLSGYEEFSGLRLSAARVHTADSTFPWPLNGPVDLVLTSPPYLNAVEYSRRHKLEYVWLDLVESEEELRRMPSRYIGHRAWGKHKAESKSFGVPLIDNIVADLVAIDYRRARAFVKYCNQMNAVFTRAREALLPGGLFIAVVGRSRVRDTVIPTDEVLVCLADRYELVERFDYQLRNRFMSYSRHNGADISQEHILVLRVL